ncbi:MAP6 domain-containing protein 1 [Erythrolamprus reginae]|uniref:MAP6 domain-containing protein 1 n=1 Tax=Erythrolamprus reginae TaxID=121349 RepID=UPI00396C7FED
MAWPCISRVCCLARFWDQLDKSDLAVPLTIHNYSDIEEGAEAGGGDSPPQPRVPPGGTAAAASGCRPQAPPRATSALPVSASAPSLRDGLAAVKRPSKKSGGRHRKEPFAAETQYQQDFRAWPLQKRDALPCLGEARKAEAPRAPPAASAHADLLAGSRVYVLPAAGQEGSNKDVGSRQVWPSSSPPGIARTSYRHEYHPWSSGKQSRPTKTTQGFIIPEDHFVQESSYMSDFKIPEAKSKFSSNPSAVFQAPSHILSI